MADSINRDTRDLPGPGNPRGEPWQESTVIQPDAARTDGGHHGSTSNRHQGSTSIPGIVHIGRYRVVGELGEGGFGKVFLAHDDLLNRPVAVKLLKRSSASVTDAARESSLLASMRHPGIAEVFDTGVTGDGNPFIVTRLIDGQPLSRLIASGPIDTIQCAKWTLQIAQAVQQAHSKGITHRDIKPSNIMITSAGDAVVLDFGVALLDTDVRSGVDYSGTPAWMSPEQAAGRVTDVDGRSDIFSIGCVFYEMLTGVRAFRGSTNTAILALIQTSEPRPPRQIRADRPAELESICLKCLRKRRDERFPAAADLASALQAALSRLGASPRRFPMSPVAVGGASVLLAATLFFFFWWLPQRPSRVPVPTMPPAESEADPNVVVADAIRQILARMEKAEARRNAGLDDIDRAAPDVEKLPSSEEAGKIPVFPAGFDVLEKDITAAVENSDHEREFSLLLKASNELIESRHYAIAEQVARRMVSISEGNEAKHPIAFGELGMALYKRGKFDEAVICLKTAIDTYQLMYDNMQKMKGPQMPQFLSQLARMLSIAWMRTGNAHKFAGQYDEAADAYRTAMRFCETHHRDAELLTLLMNYGSMESMRGNHLTAKTLLTQGIDVAGRLNDPLAQAEMQLNLANANSRGGDNKAAISLYEQVEPVSIELDSYELRSKLLLNFAKSLLEENRQEEAREKLLELERFVRPGDTDATEALELLKDLEPASSADQQSMGPSVR